jgi:heat shock protein HslJ
VLRRNTAPTLVITLAMSLVLAACGGGSAASPAGGSASAAADRLDGTSWQLQSVADEPVPSGIVVTLEFASGTASGSGGCNSYSGRYTVDGPSMSIGPVAATERACEEPAMSFEQAYYAALGGVTTWAVPQDAKMGTQLTLTGSGPKLVFGPPAGG